MHLTKFPILLLAALLADSAAAQGLGSLASDANRGESLTPASRSARPILISGNVRTSSGQTPSEPASIKRLCGTETFIEGYTDHKGRFSIRVGGGAWYGVMDASVDGVAPGVPRGNISIFNAAGPQVGAGVDLSRCRLIADVPGYRSSSIQLGRRRAMDSPAVGTLVLTPWSGSSTASVSATTLAAPKESQKALKKAVKELNRGQAAKLPRAIALLEKAVTAYPSYAAAWTILGETKLRMGNSPGAAEAFNRALEADRGYLRPYQPMAIISVEQGDWERALELTNAALRLGPNVILQWLNAVSQLELGHEDEALAALDRLESEGAGPEHLPQTHHLRGRIFARRGDFVEAAAELSKFQEEEPGSPLAGAVEKQLAEWQALGVV